MKRAVQALLCVLAAVFLAMGVPAVFTHFEAAQAETQNVGLVGQKVERILLKPKRVLKVYSSGTLVGVMRSKASLNRYLQKEYEAEYAEDWPDASLYPDEDINLVEEESFFSYADADAEIFSWLKKENKLDVEACAVSFADDTDTYDRIYVQSEDLYNKAYQRFLSLFVSDDELASLKKGKQSELTSYGTRAVSVQTEEKVAKEKAYAPAEDILRTEEDVLAYLEYGGDTHKTYHTVQEGETMASVALSCGLSAEQLMLINRDQISDKDQELTAGMKLCTTYFSSPITISVVRHTLKEETISPSLQYVIDDTLPPGETRAVQAGTEGSTNCLYEETWRNGVLTKGSLLSSVENVKEEDEIIAVSSQEAEKVGTGTWVWPVDNVQIACGWECCEGHDGLDLINTYNRYGNVYASDSGTVYEKGWNASLGYYLILDHHNGMRSHYCHLYSDPDVNIGDTVVRGDLIGQIGASGSAEGPSLYFYVTEDDGTAVNLCTGELDCEGYEQ